jgi:MYXO-CTERM domain-containing protein
MSPTSPVVSGRVLYVASLTDGLKAFPTDCAAACVPAWTWRGASGIPTGIRTVVATRDRVFAGGADGNLYVFGPRVPSRVSSTAASNTVAVVVYGGLALAVVAVSVMRRRRRI